MILSSFVVLSVIFQTIQAVDTQPPKLLLISLDGLRYDFITPQRTPALWMLSRQGVFFERGVKVQVHTVTASNHYSIVTGLYQESHGIIDNDFWDPNLDDVYDVWNFRDNKTQYERSKLAYWYEGTTPIWQTNEEEKYSAQYDSRNRRRSGSLLWPMGDCFINNKRISRNITWLDYNNEYIWRKEIDMMISWLTDEKEPINFLMYYNAQPDHIEHYSDVYGEATGSVIEEVDSSMGYMIERLRAASLLDRINIILTADHGHTNIPDKEHIIELADYLDYDKIILNARSIFPKPGSGVTAQEIYDNLTRARIEKRLPMQVWHKNEFPLHYHYANNSRIGPILVFEDLHYQLLFYGSVDSYSKKKHVPFGTHGWLNHYAEMNAFFIAHGPAFKKGLIVPGRDDIENIDIYPLMCKILGIEPVPNNGSLDRIKFILREESEAKGVGNWTNIYLVNMPTTEKFWALTFALIPVVSLVVLGLFCLIDHLQRGRSRGEGSGSGLGYRLLRHASPEAHFDMTKRPNSSRMKDTPNNGSLTAVSVESANAFAKKHNGDRPRSARPLPNTASEDGRRQLVTLSDESSDENEL